MDWPIILIIAGAGVVILALVLVMLNRAWGDFPGRIEIPPQAASPLSSSTQQSSWGAQEAEDLPDAAIPDAAPPSEGMIPLRHPLVRQAALQAIERGAGNPYAQYLFQHGDEVLLNLDAITDPEQRATIARVVHTTNNGGEVGLSMIEVFRVLNQLGRRP